jgi:hypothetical protein
MSITPPRLDQQTIPAEINRWNWGAFLLNWIWGIGNQTYIALLALIPVFGFIMLFVLGAKGSAWAWRNGRWDSVEHFKRVQRRWAIAGVAVWLGVLVLGGGIFVGVFQLLKHSAAYEMTAAKLQASPVADEYPRHPDLDRHTVRPGLHQWRVRQGGAEFLGDRPEGGRRRLCRGNQARRRLDDHPPRAQAQRQRQGDRPDRRR